MDSHSLVPVCFPLLLGQQINHSLVWGSAAIEKANPNGHHSLEANKETKRQPTGQTHGAVRRLWAHRRRFRTTPKSHTLTVFPPTQEGLLLSVLPRYIAVELKSEVIKKLSKPKDNGENEGGNKHNFHSLYVRQHKDVRWERSRDRRRVFETPLLFGCSLTSVFKHWSLFPSSDYNHKPLCFYWHSVRWSNRK